MDVGDWSNLLVAAIVPFLSVYVAQRLARKDSRISLAMEVLVKVRGDAHGYMHAFLARHPEVWNSLPPEEKPLRQIALLEAAAALDADCLRLGLLFGRRADKLGNKLANLADTSHILFEKPLRDGKVYAIQPFSNCQQELSNDIKSLCEEMRPLWDIVQREPVLLR